MEADPLAQRVGRVTQHCLVVGDHTTSGELERLLAEVENLRAPVQRLLLQKAAVLEDAGQKVRAEMERRRFNDLLPHARRHFEQGELDQAIAACERYLDRLGDDSLVRAQSQRWRALRAERESRLQAVALHEQAGRWERALAGIEKLTPALPLSPATLDLRDQLQVRLRHEQGLLELAAAAEARGDRTAALRLYGKVLARRPLQEAAQRAVWRIEEPGSRRRVLWRLAAVVLVLAIGVLAWQGYGWWTDSWLQNELARVGQESSLEARISALEAFLRRFPGEPSAIRRLADARDELATRDAQLFQIRQDPDFERRQQALLLMVDRYGQDLAINAELVRVRARLAASGEPDRALRVALLAAYLQDYPDDGAAFSEYHLEREFLRNSRLRDARAHTDPVKKLAGLRLLLKEYPNDVAVRRQLQSTRWEWKDALATSPEDLAQAGQHLAQLPAFRQEFASDPQQHAICQRVREAWLARTVLRDASPQAVAREQSERSAFLGLPPLLTDLTGLSLAIVPGEGSEELDHGLYIGTREIQVRDWQTLLGGWDAASSAKPEAPLGSVSWPDAARFCNALSAQWGLVPLYGFEGEQVRLLASGPGVRLPSPSEWERACRAGTETPYFWGAQPNRALACFDRPAPEPPGRFSANAWGLVDMHGNLAEWTCRLLEPGAVLEDRHWQLCGGSFADAGENCAATSRAPAPRRPDARAGFRIVLVLP